MASRSKLGPRSDDFYVQRMHERYQLAKYALAIPGLIALWFPLDGALPIAEAFAGKGTTVSWSVSVSVVVSLGSLGGWLVATLRGRRRGEELQRFRARAELLEELAE